MSPKRVGINFSGDGESYFNFNLPTYIVLISVKQSCLGY